MTAAQGSRGLDDTTVEALADELAEATRTRGTIERPSVRHPTMTVDDAYAVQRLWRARCEADGRRLVGRKIGLTSKVMQVATGISEPDYGVILDDQLLRSGATLEHARYATVRIEVELAFVLGAPIGAGAGVDDVLAATEWIVPALEVLDSHVRMEGRTIVDTISDNAALGAVVVGETRVRPADVDLRWVGALLSRNGEIEDSGVSGAVLGHPAMGVAWLAGKLAAHGDRLEAGETILAGSFTKPTWVEPGDEISCDYRDLGVVTCRFD